MPIDREMNPNGSKRMRAKHACRECNARRVRCNVMESNPCYNCKSSNVVCEVIPSRRGRYPRKPRHKGPPVGDSSAIHGTMGHPVSTPAIVPNDTDTEVLFMSPGATSNVHPSPRTQLQSETGEGTVSTPSASAQSSNLFFGESNFLTLVPRPSASNKGPPASRGSHMSFSIPRTPQSSVQADNDTPKSTSQMSAAAERYLVEEGALTFPPLRSYLPALQAYFTWFHPCFPVLDRADVQRRVSSAEMPPILLQAMLFIGSTYCDDETIVAMGFRDRFAAKLAFYTRARLLFHTDIEKDGMTLVQALFLMSFWRGGPSDGKDVRYWLGVAITFAESYGFHRSTTLTTQDPNIARMRRRMWWSIYVRERQAAVSLGLPSRIRDEDCDVEALSPSDLESAPSGGDKPFGASKPEHATYVIKMIEIARLLGKVIDLHFVPGRTTHSAREVETLSKRLEDWKSSLPRSMNWNDDEQSDSVWRDLLCLAYNHLYILIHRNSLLRDAEKGKKESITKAASRISRIAEDMLAQQVLQYGQMHMITSFFAALCVHAITIKSATGLMKTIAVHRAQMCLMGLKGIQKYWKINNNILDIFWDYLDKSIALKIQSSEHETGLDPNACQDEGEAASNLGHLQLSADLRDSSITEDEAGRGTEEDSTKQHHPVFHPMMGGFEDAFADLGMYFDTQSFAEDEVHFEGLDLLQRAL